jgi:hypothetical protein
MHYLLAATLVPGQDPIELQAPSLAMVRPSCLVRPQRARPAGLP